MSDERISAIERRLKVTLAINAMLILVVVFIAASPRPRTLTVTERGGYVTYSPSRNVALSLDNRDRAGQTAILVAGPSGGSALTLSYGDDLVEMRVDDDTGPSIHAMQSKQVAFHEPPTARFEKTEACKEMRSVPRDQALAWCRTRVSEEACQACLQP